MASIQAVATAIAKRLRDIPGLQVYTEPPGTVDAPAVIVALNAVTYDSTMSRGTDDLTFTLDLFVSKQAEGAANLYSYLDGSGDNSIVELFADEPKLDGAVQYAVITEAAAPDRAEIGQAEFLHVTLTLVVSVLGELP